MKKLKNQGFTLIEMMIVVAVIGVLAAIAYPSYKNHIIKSNRAAAKAQMLDLANREQQWLLANRTYATHTQMNAAGFTLPAEVASKYTYEITVDATTVPAYTITFTPQGGQVTDGALTLNSNGVKLPADKW